MRGIYKYYGCGGRNNECVLVKENINEEAISEQYFENRLNLLSGKVFWIIITSQKLEKE